MPNINLTESFKVYYPHYKTSIRYAFILQCPNLDHKLSLSLLYDGTVHGDIHYYDVCKVADSVNIAYNNERAVFEIDKETQTMVDFPILPKRGLSRIPREWEIMKPFLDHYSLTPNWIDCNRKWGTFDKDTGTWTGAVGKVRNF